LLDVSSEAKTMAIQAKMRLNSWKILTTLVSSCTLFTFGIKHFSFMNSVASFPSIFLWEFLFIKIQMLATKNPTAMAAVMVVQVHVVEQQAGMEVEDNYCTSEEVIKHLAMVLRGMVEQMEDNHEMLIQNYSGLEM